MVNLNVKVRHVDDDTLFTHKTIQLGHKSIETPIKALSVGKAQKQENIASTARGFNELYFEATPEQLEEAQTQFNPNLKKNIGDSLNRTQDGEFIVNFVNFKSIEPISEENLNYLVDLIYSTSDFVTTPLMPNLLSAIKDDASGTSSTYFMTYLENLERFIDTARQINSKPIMATIPSLPSKFVNMVIDLYMEKGIRAFCFNFNGRTVTAESQLTDMVAPLMRKIAVENKEEDVVLYAVNAHRGRSTKGADYIPARDFMSFGFGLDILGDKHLGAKLPSHLYDKLEDSDATFRLFDREKYAYENLEFGQPLRNKFPQGTDWDVERVLRRQNDKYRLATLINGEQQAKEINDLRPEIGEYNVVERLEEKDGVGKSDLNSMKTTKSKFENNQGQSTLSGLDNLIG